MIDAALFDLTGVLTTSPWADIGAIGRNGATHEEVLAFLVGPYDEDTDHLWHRFERGEISARDWAVATMTAAEAAGIEIDLGGLQAVLTNMRVHEVVVDHIRALRAGGVRTALVTNNIREGSSGWRALLPVDELFEVVVDSSHVGLRKPNPAIYLHALELLGGVEPARAVHLDDMEGNVIGARRAGLHAILVDPDDPRPALAALDELRAS